MSPFHWLFMVMAIFGCNTLVFFVRVNFAFSPFLIFASLLFFIFQKLGPRGLLPENFIYKCKIPLCMYLWGEAYSGSYIWTPCFHTNVHFVIQFKISYTWDSMEGASWHTSTLETSSHQHVCHILVHNFNWPSTKNAENGFLWII